MSNRKVFIGLDGGGTKTLTVCVDTHTRAEVGRSASACTNHNSVGEAQARVALQEGVRGALKAAGAEVKDVGGIILSMSGVDRPEDKAMVGVWLDEVLPGVPYGIHNDAVAALASGTGGDLYGVVVISGTGMIAYGYNEKGEIARAGGWGPLLGDQGSGYDIGCEVLKAVVRAKDGVTPATALTEKVLSFLNLTKEDDLISWVYAKHDEGWMRIAKVAIFAHECAKAGDEVANRVLEDAAANLITTISAVVRRLGFTKEFPLIMAGGNVDHDGSVLADKLVRQLKEKIPLARPSRPKVEPAVGAALLSLATHGK